VRSEKNQLIDTAKELDLQPDKEFETRRSVIALAPHLTPVEIEAQLKALDLDRATEEWRRMKLAVIPEVPQENLPAWEKVWASGAWPETKLGMRYVLSGFSYREAAKIVDIERMRLWRCADNLNIRTYCASTDRIDRMYREVEVAALEEIIDRAGDGRLSNDNTSTLSTVASSAGERLEKREKARSGDEGMASVLERLAETLQPGEAIEGSFKIERTETGIPPVVTPESDEQRTRRKVLGVEDAEEITESDSG
jgi:hypothetical protein